MGTDTFTVAMSFTPEGRGAILVVADIQGGGSSIAGIRQDQTGKLTSFNAAALDVIEKEHPFLVELWAEWQAGKEEDRG